MPAEDESSRLRRMRAAVWGERGGFAGNRGRRPPDHDAGAGGRLNRRFPARLSRLSRVFLVGAGLRGPAGSR